MISPETQGPLKNRRLVLGLRGMMALILVAAVGFAYAPRVRRMRVQGTAVEALNRERARFLYDYQFRNGSYVKNPEIPEPDWLVRRLGLDFFHDVTQVHASPTGGPASADELLVSIGRLDNLEELVLGGNRVGDSALPSIGRLKELRRLELGYTSVGGKGLARVLEGMSKLEHLTIPARVDVEESLGAVGRLKRLQSLEIVTFRNPAAPEAYANLKNLAKMRKLSIIGGVLGLDEPSFLEGMPLLEELSLPNCDVRSLKPFRSATRLISLDLAGNPVGDDGLEALTASPALSYLNLSRTAVTDAGIAKLTQMPGLTHLSLESTEVSNASMSTIARFPNLTRLRLDHTKVTDAGVRELAKSASLESLSLDGTRITAGVLDTLKLMKKCNQVSVLGTLVDPRDAAKALDARNRIGEPTGDVKAENAR